MHVQLMPDWDSAPPQALAAVFGELRELDWTHADHVAADRLLDACLPHATSLQVLHISGPGEKQGFKPREAGKGSASAPLPSPVKQ